MPETYELHVTCKNPKCQKAFPLETMPEGIDGPAFPTHGEAMQALVGMVRLEAKQAERNLHSIVHNPHIADTEHHFLAQGCPFCHQMYIYPASDVFVQMPLPEVSTDVFAVDL